MKWEFILPLQFGCILFLFLVWLLCLWLVVICWVEVVRVGIPASVPDSSIGLMVSLSEIALFFFLAMLCSMWNLISLTRRRHRSLPCFLSHIAPGISLGFSHTSTSRSGAHRLPELVAEAPQLLGAHWERGCSAGPTFLSRATLLLSWAQAYSVYAPWFCPFRLSPCSPRQSSLQVCPLKPKFQHLAPAHTVDVDLKRAERYQLSV